MDKKDNIIITIGKSMWKDKSYKNWLNNFLQCMTIPDCSYWLRQGNQPKKQPLQYVYLCIGDRIRFRAHFVESHSAGWVQFYDGAGGFKKLFGKAWIVICGPVEKPLKPIYKKGFQGFRYTEPLF